MHNIILWKANNVIKQVTKWLKKSWIAKAVYDNIEGFVVVLFLAVFGLIVLFSPAFIVYIACMYVGLGDGVAILLGAITFILTLTTLTNN